MTQMPVNPTVTAAAVDEIDGMAASVGATDSGQRKECVTVDEITMRWVRTKRRRKIGGKPRERSREVVLVRVFQGTHAAYFLPQKL
jgi:hypothetical protein